MPVQATNSIQNAIPGYSFSATGETLIIAAGVIVSSNTNVGVFTDLAPMTTLVNHGSVLSSGAAGASYAGDNAKLFNQLDGIISGFTGLSASANGITVRNRGEITGFADDGVRFAASANNIDFTNSGYVFGPQTGVRFGSSSDGGTLRNSGLIESDGTAVAIFTGAGLTTDIANSGELKGGNLALSVDNGGRLSLNNSGEIFGDIRCNSTGVNDAVVNSGRIAGQVFLGSGNDAYNGAGGTSGSVFGLAGVDRLTGGSAADRFFGGVGNDIVVSGAGRDILVFDTALNGTTNVDRFNDFAVNVDKLHLDDDVFTAIGARGTLAAGRFVIGASAADAQDRVIYAAGTGGLFYDPDGTGAAPQVRFATLGKNLAIDNADFMVVA